MLLCMKLRGRRQDEMWAVLQSLKTERKEQGWEDSFWNSGMFSRETACRWCFLGLVETLPLKKVHLEQEPPAVFDTARAFHLF